MAPKRDLKGCFLDATSILNRGWKAHHDKSRKTHHDKLIERAERKKRLKRAAEYYRPKPGHGDPSPEKSGYRWHSSRYTT